MDLDRVLIVRQPHADNLVDGIKPWEMRSTKTNVRGRIGIAPSGSGRIIGEVNLVDSLDAIKPEEFEKLYCKHVVNDFDLLLRWKFPWVVASPVRYEKPVPYHHPNGAVIWVRLN